MPLSLSYYFPDQVNETHFLIEFLVTVFFFLILSAFNSLVFGYIVTSLLVSLACVTSETHNLRAVVLRIYDTKRESWCQVFLAEIVETGNKNR